MKSSIALLALAAITAAAGAQTTPAQEWVNYGECEIGVHYFAPASVRAEGNVKRVWRLIDRREKLSNGIQSGAALLEIDCRGGTYRYLQTMQYSGKMAQGRYIGGDGQQDPEHFGPGTMVGQLAKLVC